MVTTYQQLKKVDTTGPATLVRIALVVEYDGTHYHGSQLQSGLPTIQGEIEEALRKLTGVKSRVKAAGRTDAGVHAEGQVFSFSTQASLSLKTFITGLNYYLPDDIAVKSTFRMNDSLNVRSSALSREYKYYILNSATRSPLRQEFTYRVKVHLDTEAMNQACQALIGKHDFSSFITGTEAGKKNPVRDVYRAEIKKNGDTVIFTMEANSFLPHQIRNTVGALIQVGLRKMTVEDFHRLVEARSLGLARPTVPACGLFLTQINYPVPLGETLDENL